MAFKVGIELHVYLNTDQKLFCTCPVDFDAAPNTTICPICTGQPGSKPKSPTRDTVSKAITVAKVLGCQLSDTLLFQRKHYSWPDLPNGYQRTMSGDFSMPVGTNGKFRDIGIMQCHLEEDPARWDPVTGRVDYNRSGYPLIEIVTEPDFTDLEKLRAWLDELVLALTYVGAIHPEAGFKGDVNVSIAPDYERVEIKNINSFTAMIEAVEFETKRQRQLKDKQQSIAHETRAWVDATKETVHMRSKENAADYRFLPEPDLPKIHIHEHLQQVIDEPLPDMPWQRKQQLVELGLPEKDAIVLTNDVDLLKLYDQVFAVDALLSAKWIRREVVRVANYKETSYDKIITVDQLKLLLELIKNKKITENVAQKIMEAISEAEDISTFNINEYIEQNNLASVSDSGALEKIAQQVIDEQPKAVEDFRAGSEKSLHFLVGQVMRYTKGAAAPDVAREVLKKLLD